MEIGRVTRSTITTTDDKKVVTGRKSFSQSFGREKERKSQEQLKKMCDDIKKRGNSFLTLNYFLFYITIDMIIVFLNHIIIHII